jgi:uncharacterized protein YodC (DUF2158 family)
MVNTISFRRGDLVQLNSGGPRMIVDEVEDEEGSVLVCKWYVGHVRHVERFFVGGLHHFKMSAAGG